MGNMTPSRKLAAIMFSDIVGYSALMSTSEALALEQLGNNQTIHRSAIGKYEGELVKEMGDGNLILFNSAYDAVCCAKEIMSECQTHDLDIRIGIHIGEIIIRDNDAFGDSVNIASRIESLAEPGNIYISSRVQEDIENKPDIITKFIGVKSLKNISHPVNIYSVLLEKKESDLELSINLKVLKENSIAVLPFSNMSPYPEQEYFCDGMSEELINALTKVRNLNVVARTSSFAFKGDKRDIREIGKKLNVSLLVEGSVRKSGDRLRITVQLIKVEDGYHLWSEKYDRKMEDIFAIQDEITTQIVAHLKSTISVQMPHHQDRNTANVVAYDNYLKGRYHLNKFNPVQIYKAIEYYKLSISEDPTLSLAYSSLAEAYTLLSTGFDVLPSSDAMPKARAAAIKSLDLNPSLAESYVSLALVSMFYDWDRKSTLLYFQKALELNPNSSSAHQWFEFYWSFMEGDFDNAMTSLEEARKLDPLNLLILLRKGYIYMYQRDFESSVKYFQEFTVRIPEFPMGYLGLMDSLGQQKKYKEALLAGKKMIDLGANAVANIGVLGFYFALSGQKEEANIKLQDLMKRSKKGYVTSVWIATIYHGLGEKDQTFDWLEKAYQDRDGNLIYITIPPQFDSLRSDPRFTQLMNKMGLENILELTFN